MIHALVLFLLLMPSTITTSDESLEECGMIVNVFMFDMDFDPDYFDQLVELADAEEDLKNE
jgi:hypothetical protein